MNFFPTHWKYHPFSSHFHCHLTKSNLYFFLSLAAPKIFQDFSLSLVLCSFSMMYLDAGLFLCMLVRIELLGYEYWYLSIFSEIFQLLCLQMLLCLHFLSCPSALELKIIYVLELYTVLSQSLALLSVFFFLLVFWAYYLIFK